MPLTEPLHMSPYGGKRIVATSTAYLDDLSTMDFSGADIWNDAIFVDGRNFIDEFCNKEEGGAHQTSM